MSAQVQVLDETKQVGQLNRDSEVRNATDFFNTEVSVKIDGIAPGTVIADRYEIVEFVGQGGMGSVYKARHKLIGNIIAIKFLHPHLLKDAASLERFKSEVKAAINLRHERLMAVSDYGVTPSGQPYIVMDFVDGFSLSDLLRNHKHLSIDEFFQIFEQVCDGLAHVHLKGVVHRDIKPSNIMLSKTDDGKWSVHIVDFGIAKVLPRGRGAVQHLTQTGEIFGSPLYMSPEQCKGKPVDERSDIYSLGCVMFESLTGHPPHQGESAIETLMFHVNEEAPKLSQHRHEIDQGSELEQIIAKTLVADPDYRYQKIEQVHADLAARKFTGQNITGSPSKTLGLSGAGAAKSKEDAQATTQATTIPQLRRKVLRDTFMTPILIAGAAAATVWVVSALNIKQPPVAVVNGLNDEKLHEADLEFKLAKEKVAQGFTQEAAEYAQKALDLRAQLAPNSLILAESQNQRADIAIKDAEHERSMLLQKQADTAGSATAATQSESRKKRMAGDYLLAEKLLKSAITTADAKTANADKADAPVRFRNNLVTAYLDQDKYKPAKTLLDEISNLYLEPNANLKLDPDTTQRNFHELFDGQYERLYWGIGREVDAAKLRLAHHKPERTGDPIPVNAKEPFTGIWSYGTFSLDLHQTGNKISGQTPANINQTQKSGEEPNAIIGDISGAVAHLTVTNTSDVRINAVAVQIDDSVVFHVLSSVGGSESAYIPDDAVLQMLPVEAAPLAVSDESSSDLSSNTETSVKSEQAANSETHENAGAP